VPVAVTWYDTVGLDGTVRELDRAVGAGARDTITEGTQQPVLTPSAISAVASLLAT
jgi:hypothetical protein